MDDKEKAAEYRAKAAVAAKPLVDFLNQASKDGWTVERQHGR